MDECRTDAESEITKAGSFANGKGDRGRYGLHFIPNVCYRKVHKLPLPNVPKFYTHIFNKIYPTCTSC